MNHTNAVKALMYRGGRYRFEEPPAMTVQWSTDDWIRHIDESGEWKPDIIDITMNHCPDHVTWLQDFFKELDDAGFENICINDPDLLSLEIKQDGPLPLIREMFQIDDAVTLTAEYPKPDGSDPYRTQLLFILCNDAWECLADYSVTCETVDEKISDITDMLEVKYADG